MWRDFQPIMLLYGGLGVRSGDCFEGDIPAKNPYYLDETMLERFAILPDLCDEYDIRVAVGLITGWMSGRLYIPSVLYGKNVLADPIAKKKEKIKKAKQQG